MSSEVWCSLLDEYEQKLRRSHTERNADRALFHLLDRFREDLPPLDGYFHKCFRQCDVLDLGHGGHIDAAVHSLLYEADLFWRLFEKHRIDKEIADEHD